MAHISVLGYGIMIYNYFLLLHIVDQLLCDSWSVMAVKVVLHKATS